MRKKWKRKIEIIESRLNLIDEDILILFRDIRTLFRKINITKKEIKESFDNWFMAFGEIYINKYFNEKKKKEENKKWKKY